MKFRPGSLETQLGLTFLLLLLLPTAIIGWLAYDHIAALTKAERIKAVGQVSDARHAQLKIVFQRAGQRAEGLLTDLRHRCGTQAGNTDCIRQTLKSFIASEQALGATLSKTDGTEAASLTVGESAVAQGGMPRFKAGQLARFSAYAPETSRNYFIAVDDPQGKLRLTVTYPVTIIQPIFVSHPDLGNSGETFLADNEGRFISSARYPSTQGHSDPITAIPMQRCLSAESTETLNLDYRDIPVVHGFRFVPEIGGGCIMAHIDQAEAFAPLVALKRQILSAMLGFAALAILLSLFFSHRIAWPIRHLTRLSSRIATGDYSLRALPAGYSEVAELATSFNAMTEQLVASNTGLEQRVRERTESLHESEERWHFAIDGAGDGVWDWNMETGRIVFSERYLAMLGYTNAEWHSLDDWKNQVNPEEMQLAMTALEAYLDGKIPVYSAEYRMQCADGSWKWMLARGKVVSRAADGRPLRLIGTHSDITERKHTLAALQVSEARFRGLFENANTGIASTDYRGQITSFNEAFRAILGYDADVLARMSFIDFTHPDDLKQETSVFSEMRAGLRDRYNFTARYIANGGRIVWVDISVAVIRDAQGRVLNFVGVIHDITERKADAEKLLHLAHHDALTQLPNRQNFPNRLEQAISHAKRNNKRLALLMIDLDRFKVINDRQGHHVGDLLLIEVAQRLQASVRESDIVARLGGDEFVAVITEMDSTDDAARVATKIVDSISAPYAITDNGLHTSPSIGICIYPDDALEIDDLMKKADQAMYDAKAKGRGNYQFFSKEIDDA